MAATAAKTFSSRLTALACGLTALLSGLVLLGWIFEIPALTTFIAIGPPAPFPTAFLLLLATGALWLLRLPRLPQLAALLGAVVLILGVLGLAEIWLGNSSGIQEKITLLFLSTPTHVAAHMLPHAVLAFAFLGAALLLMTSNGVGRSYVAQGFALAVMVLALQAMIGMIFRGGAISAGVAVSGMAFPAALGFLLLGVGILFLRPEHGLAEILLSKGPGGALLRFIVPVVLIVPNGLVLMAMASFHADRFGDGFTVAVLALVWVSFVMAMFFILGIYLNRKGEALVLSEQRFRAAAHELEFTNQLMERIFSNMHVSVAYLDNEFNFIRVNENYAAADQQRTTEFFVGKNHFQLYPDAENETVFRHVLESGEPYIAYAKPFEYPGQSGRGVTYWDWNLTPVKEKSGKVDGLLLTLADVTERKQAEAALQVSEARSRALLNATAETAMLLNENGTVMAINEIGAKRLHRSVDEVVGINFFALIPPELTRSRQPLVQQLFQTGQPFHLKDEWEGIAFESNAYPVFNADGQVVAAAIYAADVTERVQLQALDTLFNEIDQQVLRGLPLPSLLEFICVEVAHLLGYQFVWIGRKEPGGEISVAACAGPEVNFRFELEKIGVRWDETPQGHGPAGLTIRLGQTQAFRLSDPGFKPWRESAERFGLKSIICIPLIIRGEVYGAFSLYSLHEHSFDDPATVQRLGMIAGRICVALEKAMDQQQLRLLGTALASAGNGVFITDRRGHIQWLNQSFTRLTGFSPQEVLGETPRILKSGKQSADYYQKLWKTITAGEVWSSETIEKRKDGSEFTVQQTITPIRDAAEEVTHFISILEDITAQKITEARIQHLAHYDALTDLPNRALFYDRLQQVLVQAKRGHISAALMFLDLDRFKSVNDTLGHHIGDLLLQEVASRIRACVRESDTVARLGGDEFTVLLLQVADRESAAIVARKIIAAFAEPFVLGGHELQSSTSIGIALYPLDTEDCDKLVKCADSAMYEAKQQGRNRYCFFDASSESL
ncbi:MAG: diguanylate cyclase [Gammaproteobacteria bacterium]|nr:diguanylate cyclase [Gammaproteobacteria bacterium]MBU1733111.1 diguanylate cyclase [Gammaproteobacteria bacterium]MBU1892159.1 diguanylate cyclase [Gammaproteobacteria bacterium]